MSETPVEAVTEPELGDESQNDEYEHLPDDHPLVKSLETQKKLVKDLQNRTGQQHVHRKELADLRAKAKRLNEIEESQKSESEKAADRIAKAEAEVASLPAKVADALRTHLAALHDFDKDDVELFLTADDPEVLLKQVARLQAQSGARKRNHVPREGTNPSASGSHSDLAEFTHQLFHPGGE